MRRTTLLLLCAFTSVAFAYPFEDSKTLFAFGQDDEVLEDTIESLKEVKLGFPVNFAGHLYGNIFISENGFVSFRQFPSSFFQSINHIHSPIIAPFFADIDIATQGKIYCREETRNADELIRFDELVRKYFGENFETKSLIVVTWYKTVSKNSNESPQKHNTFQVAIGSSEGESFVAMSYPENGIQWAEVALDARSKVWAQAGLFDGYGTGITLKESGGPRMLSLDRRSNTNENGLFMYRVDTSFEEPLVVTTEEDATTCRSSSDPCHPEAMCEDLESSFCCTCPPGTFGNGYLCQPLGTHLTYHISGKLEGFLNQRQLQSTDIYGFGNHTSGISYFSITAAQPFSARELQTLFPMSGGLHWLFGKTAQGEKSGLFLTEAVFNRTVVVTFPKYDSTLQIHEEYQGLTFNNMLHVTIRVDGTLPKILSMSQPQVSEYVSVFNQVEHGVLESKSSQQFLFDDPAQEPVAFDVDQTIRFKVSPCDEEVLKVPIKLIVNRGNVRVDDRKLPGRVNMQAGVDFRTGKSALDPCVNADCGEAICVPNGDIDYRCVCNSGSEYRGGRCVQLAATPTFRTCGDSPNFCAANSHCVDTAYGASCRCDHGYQDNGQFCEAYQTGQQREIGRIPCSQTCHPMASCVAYDRESVCRCMEGTVGDGVNSCKTISCEEDSRLCPANSHCSNRTCLCDPGYSGDGVACTREVLDSRADRVIFARGITILEVPDIPSRTATTRLLGLGQDSSEIVGLTVDCIHEQIYYTDAINGKIFRVRSDGKHRQEVISGLQHPEGIAVDPSSRNVFWVDSGSKKIQVASMNNFQYTYTIVDDDLENPRGIAIHPEKGKVYFSDRGSENPRIESVSMDGNDRTTIVGSDLDVPNMLAIDVESEELCWTDAGRKSIECVSLDSSIVPTVRSRRVIYRSNEADSKIFGIALYKKRVYWTDWVVPYLQMLDRTNATELNSQKYPQAALGSSRLYSVAIVPQKCRRVRTSCDFKRGECHYMCLPTDSYGKTCVCPDALQAAGQCTVTSPDPVTAPPYYSK